MPTYRYCFACDSDCDDVPTFECRPFVFGACWDDDVESCSCRDVAVAVVVVAAIAACSWMGVAMYEIH